MSLAAILGVAALLGGGTWLLLDRDLVRTALGAVLLGHGVVLLLVGMRPGGAPPLIGPDGALPAGGDVGGGAADPLPQALALTAIVISFGVTAYLLALAERQRREDVADEQRRDEEHAREEKRSREEAEARAAEDARDPAGPSGSVGMGTAP